MGASENKGWPAHRGDLGWSRQESYIFYSSNWGGKAFMQEDKDHVEISLPGIVF